MKRIIALLVSLALIVPAAVGCGSGSNEPSVLDQEGSYTYKDSVATMATNWNPHTYETNDDLYPNEFLRVGLYDFIFNDELNPVEGKEPYSGYVIVPEMAASDPVDVTEQVKAEHPEFGIPESATSGYAYTIDLNKNACWEDGTPINADTYVYSMKRLLDPELLNYRATDYYARDLCIANAEYYANQGQTKTITVRTVMANEGFETLDEYLAAYGDVPAYVNWNYSFGDTYDPATGSWTGKAEDETVKTEITSSEMHDLYVETVTGWGMDEATANDYFMDESSIDWTYPSDIDFATVGIMKTGDYQITLVFGKALAGFNLYYSLTSNWIVKEDLYEANLKQQGDAWFSTYNTSVETTSSYGPYKLVSYQKDKSMRFERNENWYGYTDGKHVYVDPVDGNTYPMYQTTAIDCQVVAEAETRKLMFLKGELMTYGLQTADFADYRNSDYAYVTPAATIFFFIMNGHMSAIQEREANGSFDTSKYDLETMTLNSFRRALAVTYDKEMFATTVSPARSGAYGIIGNSYIYDPDTGSRYRDTDQAKQVLCDFYSVDVSQYSSLDEAAASITGYDPVKAKELYQQAFDEALAAGYITDNDGDGVSDQTVRIEYSLSADNDFMTQTIEYLNDKMNDVTTGTPFAGKIEFVKSAPYGNDWSNKLKSGLADTSLAGWSGSELNPFGLTEQYTNPSYQYDAAWFDATSVSLELEVNVAKIGEPENIQTVEMNLAQWSQALNGATITVGGTDYCFGDGIADIDTRLDILAAIEGEILGTYNYIPMLQDASIALLTQQVYYVVEEYNPIMGRGGIQYMRYNYEDTAWTDYVASQGGELKY